MQEGIALRGFDGREKWQKLNKCWHANGLTIRCALAVVAASREPGVGEAACPIKASKSHNG